jgi:hypothetical protein
MCKLISVLFWSLRCSETHVVNASKRRHKLIDQLVGLRYGLALCVGIQIALKVLLDDTQAIL